MQEVVKIHNSKITANVLNAKQYFDANPITVIDAGT